ncbi:crosslink repair DNA glycosylase YcaQ family protein [Polymorphospora sp. NPDC051019]|uniref:DNA glycosylase AlkZ-like family protein n=1 Tax=Polymorphospora sp. NPDC051019 TaxID=3155725 RepID=UPI003421D9C4
MTDQPIKVTRSRMLAYRVAAQQLDRAGADPAALAVLDLRVQDTPYGSARQARDRELLLPDRQRQRQVRRAVAAPGALLVDGEIAGTWRARLANRKRLDVTVPPFEPLSAKVRRKAEVEAERLAAVRGVPDVLLTVD